MRARLKLDSDGGGKRKTDLNMGQCAELSQWNPLFFCPVRMSQMMMACGSSLVSIRGLKVTTYLGGIRAAALDVKKSSLFIRQVCKVGFIHLF